VLGELVDVLFDPTDGSAAFFEIAPAEDTLSDMPNYLLSPDPGFEFSDHKLVVPDEAKETLKRRTIHNLEEGPAPEPTLNVAFLEANEDRVGEDDIEVTRSQTQQPF
jgi:hypothetical protein